MVAGELTLIALLSPDPPQASVAEPTDYTINIHLYGLDARQSNDKVEHIYTVWEKNLPKPDGKKLIAKDVDAITFYSDDYPSQSVKINLMINRSRLTILQRLDLDVIALGYDDSEVVMLPRCARALETGFSTFTMDIMWGHRLGRRLRTTTDRLFKYADWGFGVRILPCYVKTLEGVDANDQRLLVEEVITRTEIFVLMLLRKRARLQPSAASWKMAERVSGF